MEIREIAAMTDHTLLGQDIRWEAVQTLVDEGIRHGAASVCIPPSFVRQVKEYSGDAIPVCTVIGFPLGYQTTAVKAFEAKDAVKNGADEIDMVINVTWVKDGRYEDIHREIEAVKAAAGGRLLKVIVETCLLGEEEKIKLCKVVTDAGADYIKTSTGFAGGGATPRDIMLFAANIGSDVKIKASGGISSLDDARRLIQLGASRIGSSRIIKSLEGE